MKKIIVLGLLISGFMSVAHIEHNYTRKDCEVVKVENGVVKFKDKCGYVWDWEIEENEYFEIGDRVDLKMHDSCSANYIDDDVIKRVIFQD